MRRKARTLFLLILGRCRGERSLTSSRCTRLEVPDEMMAGGV